MNEKRETLYDITISREALLELEKAKKVFRTNNYSDTVIIASKLSTSIFDNFQRLEDFLKSEKYKEAFSLLFDLFYNTKKEVRK